MIGQKQAGWITPESQTPGHGPDSSQGNRNPPDTGREQSDVGRTQEDVAGQGADQLTDADRARLEGQ